MSAQHRRHILATLGSAILIGLLALPANAAKPTATPPPNTGNVKGCVGCHDDTDLISSKHAQWSLSRHATGEAFLRGTIGRCAGCHSGGGFVQRVLDGLLPDQADGDPSPSRQDCRACHQIHTTYTPADWALETTAAVDLYAIPGSTFDKGTGNLCASCHQPREDFPVPEDGMVGGISEHWGPHHGPQSAMMLGVGGSTTGAPATHYSSDQLPDGCVSCHMGANKIHSFEPDTSVCTTCHGSNYDYEEATQDIRDALDALGDELVSCDLLTENSPDGHPTDRITAAGATIPEDEAAALWNWLYIAHEDKSMGVHNPGYTRTLLAESTFTCSK